MSSRFRWVVCQLETLRRSAQRNLRGILEKLPKTLDETYERVLKDINEDNRDHARRLLHCLAVAIRPLRVEELAEILAFDFDDTQNGIPKFHAGWRWKDQEEAVLYTCSSLITVVDNHLWDFGKCRVVQFSHFSVKEFLVSDRLVSSAGEVSRYHILPGPAHTILAQACLGFLLHSDIPTDKETGKPFPLARYAAEHWVPHAQFENVASHLKDGMESLFDPDKPHFVAWVKIYNIDHRYVSRDRFNLLYNNDDDRLPSTPNPLCYAALCGFRDLVEHLVISNPQLINIVGCNYGFPVLAALFNKHIQVAEFLLRHGGKVNILGPDGLTPLLKLLDLGGDRILKDDHIVDLVSFLLKHGADPNFRGIHLSTPLHYATNDANFRVVQVLLESGADIDSRDDEGRTPLHLVTTELENGEAQAQDVTRLILERGANVNAQDNDGATPLLGAASWCRVDISEILLEHGAEPNVKNNNGETPLIRLFYHDDDGIPCHDPYRYSLSQLLLEHGANANEQDKDHTTPLHLAMSWQLYEIAQILLEHDAEPNMADKDGVTPLHLVLQPECRYEMVRMEDEEVLAARCVRLLLEHGADVNAQDKYSNTPLLLAIKTSMYYDLALNLLSRGAEPNVKNCRGETPLHLLLENVSAFDDDDILGLVHSLLDHGADVDAWDRNRATPLLLAVKGRSDNIARILLERSADPNLKNIRGKTPLHLLLERYVNDHHDVKDILVVERLLLERGADINAQDEHNTTPLYLACCHPRFEIAQIILDPANAEKDLHPAQSCITLEGEYNSREKCRCLTSSLDRTAYAYAQNTDLINHLHWSCYFGRLEMARELLDHGENPNAENIRGETPLHLVSRGQNSQEGVVQLLLERGANINTQDMCDMTPLHLASYYGRLEIVRVLLRHGARIDVKDNRGQTPLHLVLEGNRSVGRDSIRIVRLLLEHGADMNAQDDDNDTPLHLASSFGKLAIVRVLLVHGANANAANIRRQTPLHILSLWPWCVEYEPWLVQILVDGGADVNARDKDHETPLHTAYRNNRLDIAKCLRQRGADEDAKNNKGETPIQLAPQSTATK